ncbi:MAG: SLC13 family permease [Egibacteraceae bacterium]
MTATLTRQAPVTVAQPARRKPPRPAPRTCGALLAAVCVGVGGWVGLTGLAPPARVVLVAFGLAIVGWTMTDLDDTFVSLAAAGSLVLAGGVAADTLFVSMGDSTVWLLLASFIVAAAVSASGLSQRLVAKVAARARNVGQLFWLLTAVVLGTSFVVPATSGRAALMVPVFAALAEPIGDRRVTRALALLFPSMILLSAVASLLGAGAHLVAAELIASLGGERIACSGCSGCRSPCAAVGCPVTRSCGCS